MNGETSSNAHRLRIDQKMMTMVVSLLRNGKSININFQNQRRTKWADSFTSCSEEKE